MSAARPARRTPWQPHSSSEDGMMRSFKLRCSVAVAFALWWTFAAMCACAAAPAKPNYDVHDSHFHLTNYVQEGTDIHDFLKIMGSRVGPCRAVRHSPAADLVAPQQRRLRADLLPAERLAALLLLVHRCAHCDGLPVPRACRSCALRSDDHGIQPRRHVRGGSHQARAQDISRRVLGYRRVHDPQGIRLIESRRRCCQPDRSGAGSHPGFRR